MDIQHNIERAIHQLVDEFLGEPYRFFNKADAVSRFHALLESDELLDIRVRSKDGILLPMIHLGYPTFFRYDEAQPGVKLDSLPTAKRGHYDLVILAPGFIRNQPAETVRNRDAATERTKHLQPFQAVIEFKLEDRGWNSTRTKGVQAEMGKLILSRDEADLRYFVGLMRYSAPAENRWNKYWPDVTQSAMDSMEINSIFATNRMLPGQSPHVQSFGAWLSTYEERMEAGKEK
jgi:hypothetical protein